MGRECISDLLVQMARDAFSIACQRQDTNAEAMTRGVTRIRLLEIGRRVFAEKGHAATVRDICRAAAVNVAAVNYHFGSKEGLLAAVLAQLLDDLLVRYPMDGGVPAEAPAEERLQGFVFAFLCRVLVCMEDDEERALGQMLSEAFLRPILPFEAHAEAHRKAVQSWLVPVVAELAGKPDAAIAQDDEQLVMLSRSIVAQILMYNTNRELILQRRGGRAFTLEELAAYARHITLFSIGGIQQVSEQMA